MAEPKAAGKKPAATKAVAKKAPAEVKASANEIDAFIRIALESDSSVEKLEKLIELKNRQEDRGFKQDFDQHFAEMQAELIPVIRHGEAKTADGEKMYSYAILDDIQKTVGPILSAHGFSYRWEEEPILDGREKRVTCIISGWGHEKRTAVDMPIEESGKRTNRTQMRGVATTYGRRYSLCSATGITLENDDDAQSMKSANLDKYQEVLEAIEEARTIDELKEVYRPAYQAMQIDNDQVGIRILVDAKNVRKKEIFLHKDPDPDVEKIEDAEIISTETKEDEIEIF